jgi:LacI family transcriptional regulator
MSEKKRATVRDVADRAGVSTAVVSYVINDGPRPTSPAVRDRVRQAIVELDYHPNSAARGLRANRTHTIAFVTYDFRPTESFFSHYLGVMLTSMTQALQEQGYYLLLFPIALGESHTALHQLLREGRIDGIATRFVTDPPETDSILQLIKDSRIPCVCVERPGDPRFGFPSVTYDDGEGGRLAVEHLLERGHRRIAHIHGDLRYASAQGRLASYESTLLAAGVEIDPDLIVGSPWGTRTANIVTQQLLDLADPPTAIFAASDDLAIGAVQAIEHRGLSVPGDLAVIGFDDIPLSEEMMPRLSTVRLPLDAMGRKTAELITGASDGAVPRESVSLPVELILRETA